MAELFTNPMTSMTEAYKGTSAMIEDISSSADLKQATQQVKQEQDVPNEEGVVETKPVDMFKVNSLAAQMSASRGDTRSADKFQKQANDYKKDALVIASKDIDLQQAKLEKAEQDLQLMTDPQSAMDQLLKSDLPTDQKMRMATLLKQVGDDPEKFKAFKSNIQNAVMTAKDRLTAEQRTLKMKQDHEDKVLQRQIQLEQVRSTAAFRERTLDLQQAKLDWQQEKFESEYGLKSAKTVADVEQKTRSLISKIAKDPLKSADQRKAEIESITAGAERTIARIESAGKGKRGGKSEGGEGGGSKSANIPQEAIDDLIANPSLESAFNEKYKTSGMSTPAKEYLERAKQEGKITKSDYKTNSEKVADKELEMVMKQRNTFFTGPVDYKAVSEDASYSKSIRAAALKKYKQMMRED